MTKNTRLSTPAQLHNVCILEHGSLGTRLDHTLVSRYSPQSYAPSCSDTLRSRAHKRKGEGKSRSFVKQVESPACTKNKVGKHFKVCFVAPFSPCTIAMRKTLPFCSGPILHDVRKDTRLSLHIHLPVQEREPSVYVTYT